MSALPVEQSQTRGLSLADLLPVLAPVRGELFGSPDVWITDVCQDSRDVAQGALFVARSGGERRGADFARIAVQAGAHGILAEDLQPLPDLGVPVLRVRDARLALALAAEAVHGYPSRDLKVVGVTGTNGKTTSTWLMERALQGAGASPARLGTLGFSFQGDLIPSPLTTPQADSISRLAARVRDAGGSHFLMEVSSHALEQARVEALRFEIAVFTNLSQDHLDYHGDMDSYGAAKRRLFVELAPELAVINTDDSFGASLACLTRSPVVRVGRQGGDVFASKLQCDAGGIAMEVQLPGASLSLDSRLVGMHNVDNLLLTLAVVHSLGLDTEAAARALAGLSGVPGRLERCDGVEDDIVVLVDYAHTPAALERALCAARALGGGAVHCVFGCGGDRDRGKRPQMGAVAAASAHHVYVTNDNPRSEDPRAIASAIEQGLVGGQVPYLIELDRASAIERAVLAAQPGDVVLVAGKGHEPYQIIGTESRDFDDRVQARAALLRRREGVR